MCVWCSDAWKVVGCGYLCKKQLCKKQLTRHCAGPQIHSPRYENFEFYKPSYSPLCRFSYESRIKVWVWVGDVLCVSGAVMRGGWWVWPFYAYGSCEESSRRGTVLALKSIAPAMKTLNSINPVILPYVGFPMNLSSRHLTGRVMCSVVLVQ